MFRRWPRWSPSPLTLFFACIITGDFALNPWAPRWFHFIATAIALATIGFSLARICRWVGRNPYNPSIKTAWTFAVIFTILTALVSLDHKVASISFLVSFWLTMCKTPWLELAKKSPARRLAPNSDRDPPYAA